MRIHRRRFLQLTGAAAAAVPHRASALDYPIRPVRLVVGFAPGTGPDVIARLTGQWLSERTGQQFVVEDRPGAASNIAVDVVVNAPSDGYTLLQITSANAINATLYHRLSFMTDITPVASVAGASFAMVVNSRYHAKTLAEFIAEAKADPGKIIIGSSSTGTTPYMAAELFKMMSGTDILHVPYGGTPQAVTEVLAERVQLAFADMSSIEYIKSGSLRALAVTAAAREDALPHVPTVGEVVPGYEARTWYGVGAPKNASPEIIERLNREVNAALAEPKTRARLADLGFTAMPGSPAQFGKLIADETAKWGNVIQAANIKL